MLYKTRGRQSVHILLSSRSIYSYGSALKQPAIQTVDVDLGTNALAQCFRSTSNQIKSNVFATQNTDTNERSKTKSNVPTYHCHTRPKFTDDLRTILRQFSDLRQSYDNWRIHKTFTTILRPI